ncbi:MAG: hypothetical protein M1333_02865, partial [Patescibacteria group bacterium]|nr:hypothetical protein [Patescibacteria group bacterium]
MSPKRPGGEGETDNIDFALEQIKIDTEKARIMPTREQFRDLAQKVRALTLGRGYAKATPWEKYSADLSVILQMLPRPAARGVNARYREILSRKYYQKPVWDEFYEYVLNYFHDQAAKAYGMAEEKEFWKAG